jgi:hypothetical protein
MSATNAKLDVLAAPMEKLAMFAIKDSSTETDNVLELAVTISGLISLLKDANLALLDA